MEVLEKSADQLSQSDQEAARKAAAWVPIADDLSAESAKIIAGNQEAEHRFAERLAAKESNQSPPPTPPVDLGGDVGDNDEMEARVAKLEAAMEFVQRDIADIKLDLREIRTDIKEVRSEARTDFRLLFGAIIAVALGLAGLMAKGFHWL